MPTAIFGASIVISLTILLVAFLNYRRKSGVHVRGAYSIASDENCDDQYVTEVILENQKDRTITLYGIYLQVGYAYLIQIEDFEDAPHLLKPFETFHQEYGPIEHYEVSLYKVNFNSLLEDRHVRKRLVLSTSEGRYVVKESIRRWHPVADFFKNHFSAMARPVLSKYKDMFLGNRVKYVIEFATEDGKEEIVPVLPGDHRIKKFREFSLTKEALANQNSLEEYLRRLQAAGKIRAAHINVHDVEEWRRRRYSEMPPVRAVKAYPHSAFSYFILGPIYTWASNIRMRFANWYRRIRAR